MRLRLPTEAETWLSVDDPFIAFYDRAGNRIPMVRFTELHADFNYKVVAKTEIAGVWEVSTVWLGHDHAFIGPPLIFETMVFELAESYDHGFTYHAGAFDHFQQRYSTETEAREGHAAVVAQARELFLPALKGA